MPRAIRRCRPNFWVALLALLSIVPASFQSWHELGDDPLCNPAVVVHDHDAHQIATATSPPAPEHCAVCHWFQTARGSITAHRLVVPHGSSSPLVAPPTVTTLARLAEGRFGRAPPLL